MPNHKYRTLKWLTHAQYRFFFVSMFNDFAKKKTKENKTKRKPNQT